LAPSSLSLSDYPSLPGHSTPLCDTPASALPPSAALSYLQCLPGQAIGQPAPFLLSRVASTPSPGFPTPQFFFSQSPCPSSAKAPTHPVLPPTPSSAVSSTPIAAHSSSKTVSVPAASESSSNGASVSLVPYRPSSSFGPNDITSSSSATHLHHLRLLLQVLK
jgi:hypothetical protein